MTLPLTTCLALTLLLAPPPTTPAPANTQTTAATTQTTAAGTLIPADQLATLLPATVYFQGRTAPIQLRNAAAITFPGNKILWIALVDSSGYSSGVQEKYQFYLVTEAPLRLPTTTLPAGAYGGGFVGDHFLFMNLGGDTVAQGPLQTDPALHRPRPLQLVPESPTSAKLYLGRHWISLQSVPKRDNP